MRLSVFLDRSDDLAPGSAPTPGRTQEECADVERRRGRESELAAERSNRLSVIFRSRSLVSLLEDQKRARTVGGALRR